MIEWVCMDIGPYLFRNKKGIAVTANSVRYRDMLNTFLF